jgi:hypothetical protein
LNHSGSLWRHDWRKATSRGQRGQSRPGIPLGRIFELFVFEFVFDFDALRARAAL